MKIQNFDELAKNDLRRAGLLIAEAGLQAIDTEKVIRGAVRLEGEFLFIQNKKYLLERVGRIFLYGVGKCSTEAVSALSAILGERVTGGVLIDVKEGGVLPRITAYLGTHPAPSKANVLASEHLTKSLSGLSEDDLVIFCVSGGASALLCLPEGEMDCDAEAEIFRVLTKAGATIQELNTARKHLSRARGGHLARLAYPARVVSLIFSDVPGNDIQFIGSGPTAMDRTRVKDAEKIFRKYDVLKAAGLRAVKFFETPKDKKYFRRVINTIVVSNKVALKAMALKAREVGYTPRIETDTLQGEAREVGRTILKKLRNISSGGVLLYGGETTVKVLGDGKGGRNQEVSLGALSEVHDGEFLLSFASDGRDNSDVAGGICDVVTSQHANKKGLNPDEFLRTNDSFHFFESSGDALITGRTGANVSDLIVAIKGKC